ncbi:ABC-2 type transport system permease protein [Mesonia algae]|uniref:ABC-2 type transport system permease protein n=1 Tax=Mesonia algae TaxID=213248 RepID=A0A2W7I0T7_9FLAO|nr:gliding motility-associated ABC transporter permease subunit GldF [Mesonia algae]PZW38875.1 ABC-2 type transport system permease protein [Mesonia algae]
MKAIFFKEINSFFSSTIGYLVVGIFLIVCGLFLWVFTGEFNILDNGFANLSPFFLLAPWVFLFLIPAITMRSIAEEKKQGTLEILLTQPITKWQLVLGKYFGAFALSILAIIPTLLYVYAISELGSTPGNYDLGVILGSYVGLLLLSATYTSIGIFASSLTENQIVSFILAVLLCFLLYFAFDGISNLAIFNSETYGIEYLGLSYHYKSISRGVIDTRDLIYFISIIFLFLSLTKFNLEKENK